MTLRIFFLPCGKTHRQRVHRRWHAEPLFARRHRRAALGDPRSGTGGGGRRDHARSEPRTVEAARFAGFRQAGVNRISVACKASTIACSRLSSRPPRRGDVAPVMRGSGRAADTLRTIVNLESLDVTRLPASCDGARPSPGLRLACRTQSEIIVELSSVGGDARRASVGADGCGRDCRRRHAIVEALHADRDAVHARLPEAGEARRFDRAGFASSVISAPASTCTERGSPRAARRWRRAKRGSACHRR